MNNKSDQIELDNSLKLIVKSSFIVFIGLIISKILTYTYKIIVARYYGPEVYGLFSLALMILSLFVCFFSFGLPEGILRYAAFYRGKSETNKVKYILRFSLIVLFFSGILSTIILFISSDFISLNIFHNSDLIIYLKWFSFFILLSIFLNFFLALIRAYEKISSYSFIINILQPALSLIILILLIFIGFNSQAIILSCVSAILIALLISFTICNHSIFKSFGKQSLNKTSKKEVISSLISYSWPLTFLMIISNLFVWTDSFMIGYFKGVLDVGFYNVSITFVNLFNLAPLILMSLFYPLVVKEFSRKRLVLIRDLSKQITKWICIINLPILILFILFPGAIINVFFGPEFLIAENSLRILSIGSFFFFLFIISNDLLSMKGKSKILLINIISLAIFNFLFNLLLIPKYGINGAAFSTAVSLSLLGIILTLEVRHFLSIILIKRKILRVLLVSLIPTLILTYFKSFFPKSLVSLILQGVFFILIYLLLILLTGCLDENDFMILNLIKGKISKINPYNS